MHLFGKKPSGTEGVPLERTTSHQATSSLSIPFLPASSSSYSSGFPISSSPPADPSLSSSLRSQRVRTDSLKTPSSSQPTTLPYPPLPSAVDLHNALANSHSIQSRDRSASSSSATRFDLHSALKGYSHNRNRSDSSDSTRAVVAGEKTISKSRSRPSILRGHSRSISGGQSPPAAVRMLRFDSSSNGSLAAKDLATNSSSNSLLVPESRQLPDSAPAAVPDFDLERKQDSQRSVNHGRTSSKDLLLTSSSTQTRPRGLSHASSESSLSPIAASADTNDPSIAKDFPFSLNSPPPAVGTFPSPAGVADLPNESSDGGDVGPRTVPPPLPLTPSSPALATSSEDALEEGVDTDLEEKQANTSVSAISQQSDRSLDIDVSQISSHAQAEALVQKAQQDILDLMSTPQSAEGSEGFVPLSARLAAYGESLELERKLREKEQAEKEGTDLQDEAEDGFMTPRTPTSRAGVNRQFSLENRANAKPRSRGPRRPHTASGASSTPHCAWFRFSSVCSEANPFKQCSKTQRRPQLTTVRFLRHPSTDPP
jgi:hypothetical protein